MVNKAVFIDRDGVINNDEGLYYIYKPEHLKFNVGVIDNLKLLHDAGYMLIVISNQGGIGKALYKKSDTDFLHGMMDNIFRASGVEIVEYYYCPHHPDSGSCICRKPDSLLIEKAIARHNIDPALSYMIGDSPRDIEAAEKVGVCGFLIHKNEDIRKYCDKIINEKCQ